MTELEKRIEKYIANPKNLKNLDNRIKRCNKAINIIEESLKVSYKQLNKPFDI